MARLVSQTWKGGCAREQEVAPLSAARPVEWSPPLDVEGFPPNVLAVVDIVVVKSKHLHIKRGHRVHDVPVRGFS